MARKPDVKRCNILSNIRNSTEFELEFLELTKLRHTQRRREGAPDIRDLCVFPLHGSRIPRGSVDGQRGVEESALNLTDRSCCGEFAIAHVVTQGCCCAN